ncbi:hypothetical protein WA026_007724 [Henosepilachna vigintioctopunctata]|uniref:Uncharacterized protein n=1 Tax=Henosepilachna vigintioctopunctata TaxID=420089 RepID=A0AAW1U607_9CUCU
MWDKESLLEYWDRRSNLERRLILFVLILIIVLIIVLLCAIFVRTEEACVSVDCVSAATHVLDTVDPSVSPCDNFHQFVCGSYLRKAMEYNKLPVIKILEERTKNQIDAIIADNPGKPSAHSLKLQRQFYRSCINTSAVQADENETFQTLLDAVGGWPVVKGKHWDEYIFNWQNTMVKARKLGLSFQKLIGINIAYTNGNITTLQIIPPDDVDYISQEVTEPYAELIRDIAVLLHSPSIGVINELRPVVNFQNELNRIINKVRYSSEAAQEMTIHQLQEKFPITTWLQFLNSLLSGVAVLNETSIISIRSEQFMKDLDLLILKTTKRIQANYIVWKIVEKFIPFLTEDIRMRYEKFQRQYMDKKVDKRDRKEVCLELSKEIFTDVAEIEYVRKYTDSDTKFEIKRIFEKVKEEFLKRLKSSTRLTVKLKKDIEAEIENTKIYVGGSDKLFNLKMTEKALGYTNISFEDEDLAKMVTKVSVNRMNHYFKNVGTHDLDEVDFLERPLTAVNAYYRDYGNLLIPLLQDIFYNKNRPNYMNYGALVTTIGHELTHSLGKLGNRTYEKRGKYHFEYNLAFFEAFGESSQCFEKQYEHFYHNTAPNPEIPLSTNETLEENIADFVGTDIGYELYQEYVEKNGVEPSLPGLTTPEPNILDNDR